MDYELQNAVQLARQYAETTPGTWGDLQAVDVAHEIIVEAYLAEHRADDEEIVDVDWLDTLKPEDSSGVGEWWRWYYRCGKYTGRMTVEADLPDRPPFSLSVNDVCISGNATKGDVRRLARGLKIDLGER